jgi:hypothetical protein
MSDHTRALVPVDTWLYGSPELIERGRSVDIGLLAEALIYYDQILVSVANKHQFADLISLLIQYGLTYSQLIDLIQEGTLQVYNYAFYTLPFVHDGIIELWNIQDPVLEKPNSFPERFLYTEELRRCFSNKQQMNDFCEALNGKVIEVKAVEFGSEGIENAWRDFLNPRRNELIVQALVDELYQLKSLGTPPKVQTVIHQSTKPQQLHHTSWNIDFNEITKLVGEKLTINPTVPLSAAAISNRMIWSASRLRCDLFLPRPMSVAVGDKLYEAGDKLAKTRDVVDQLITRIEFPNIRRLVNEGQLDLKDVIRFRKPAQRFRKWLQTEGDRDRDAIFFYREEFERESGLINAGRTALTAFGVGAITGALGTLASDPATGAALGMAGGGLAFVLDIASKIGAGWKPIVFGNWLADRIAKLIEEQQT